ncbi:MAG: hypothetical protein V2I43_05015, partial [Parvularcula sp.]|nr:hypothetical protein [Parvularcula sp.]
MAGVAGHRLGAHPAVPCVDRQAVDPVRRRHHAPERHVARAHMAVEAARVRQDVVDVVPGGQPFLWGGQAGLRKRRGVETVLVPRQGKGPERDADGDD